MNRPVRPGKITAALKTIPRRKVKLAEVKRTRTTVTLDDDPVRKAQLFTGVKGKTALIREALTQLVQCEGAWRLAALGGSKLKLPDIPRRRLPR
jgi:Arc/MetJ family transcription regulator